MQSPAPFRRRFAVSAGIAGLATLFLVAGCACRCRKAAPPPTAGTTVTQEFPMSKGTPGIDNTAGASSPGKPAEGRAVPIGRIPKPGDAPASSPHDGEPQP